MRLTKDAEGRLGSITGSVAADAILRLELLPWRNQFWNSLSFSLAGVPFGLAIGIATLDRWRSRACLAAANALALFLAVRTTMYLYHPGRLDGASLLVSFAIGGAVGALGVAACLAVWRRELISKLPFVVLAGAVGGSAFVPF